MTRLPTPGSDDGTWGDVLNAYLEVSLNGDGTLKSNIVGTTQLQNNAVTNAQLDSPTQATVASVAGKYTKPGSGIPKSDLASSVQTSLTSADSSLQSSQLGAANGIATLDSGFHLTSSQLPSSVVSASSLGVADAGLWSSIASIGTYSPPCRVRFQGHFWVRIQPHTTVEATFIPANWIDQGSVGRIPQLQAVPALIVGDSWAVSGGGVSAPITDNYCALVCERNLTGSSASRYTNVAVSGTRSDQILMNQVVEYLPNGVPDGYGLIFMTGMTGNDVNQYAPAANYNTTTEAFRSCCVYATAQKITGFVFGPGWTSGTTSTVGSYADFAFTSSSVYLLVQFTTGSGGTITITNSAGATVATINTGSYLQTFTGSVLLSGFSASAATTLRATVTAGTATLVSVAVPAANPPVIVWFSIPNRGFGTTDTAGAAQVEAQIVADVLPAFPTVMQVTAGPNWNYSSMLNTASSGASHPNSLGNFNNADQIEYALAEYFSANLSSGTYGFVQGPNSLINPNAYTIPTPSITLPGATVPAAPGSPATSTVLGITITWTEPTDGGSTLTGYVVQTSPTGAGTWTTQATFTNPATLRAVLTTLTGGTAYDVRVAATNAVGTGAYATVTNVTAGPQPYYLDTFARTGTLAGTAASQGATSGIWSVSGTTPISTDNGFVQPTGTGAFTLASLTAPTATAGTVYARLGTINNSVITFALGFHGASGTSWVGLGTFGGVPRGLYELQVYNGTESFISGWTSPGVAQSGDQLQLAYSVSGSTTTITVWINGTQIGTTYTTTLFPSQTGVGLIWYGVNEFSTQVDEFMYLNSAATSWIGS